MLFLTATPVRLPRAIPMSIAAAPPLASPPAEAAPAPPLRRIRFNRREWGGAFGDLGTDLPLLTGMILATGVAPLRVLVLFGAMQIFSAFVYRIPMAVQPLKAVAVIVIAQRTPPELIFGAGLAIGATMLLLTLTGLLDTLARVVPKPVVRGIQFGLGLHLARMALGEYIPALGVPGYLLAATALLLTITLWNNRRYPASLVVLLLGVVYALLFTVPALHPGGAAPLLAPAVALPSPGAIVQGFLLMALAQIPLSIGNSVLATRQIAEDYFPEARVTVRRVGLTYSLMNLVAAPLGGFPVCHGSGGLAGHTAFGARTGGSVVIYGAFMILLGLASAGSPAAIARFFPLPVLGVMLLVEALALIRLMRDQFREPHAAGIAMIVGLTAAALPFGFVWGILGGTVLHHACKRRSPPAGSIEPRRGRQAVEQPRPARAAGAGQQQRVAAQYPSHE